MKVVVDTNVLLAGLFAHGICEGLLDLILPDEASEIILCEQILDEFAKHAKLKFHAPADAIARATTMLREQATLVAPATVARDSCRDPDDLAILGTLAAADADLLVTGDKDLLVLKAFARRPIMTPRQFHDWVISQ